MGVNESVNASSVLSLINRNSFDFKYVIGRGGFGKVWRVTFKKTNVYYALKEMSKVKIIDKKSEKSVMAERNLLSNLRHPFLVNMIYSFQDYDYLYLVMDLLTGGDLRYHICRHRKFSEEQTKFFMSCLILGLEYIHSNEIIHRDIKPENLVCDEKGYIRITDFGVAKKYKKENKDETSGTPGYMAPEVLCAKNHSYPVDYFALGVIGYEFMLGVRPYLGKNRKEIKAAVLSKQAHIKVNDIPPGWSLEAADLINKLIQRKVSQRLGYAGIADIKNHPWFENVNWEELRAKKISSPFIPKVGDNFDKKYCESEEHIGNDTMDRYQLYKSNDNYANVFKNYTCNNVPEEEIKKVISEQSYRKNKKSANRFEKLLGKMGPLQAKLSKRPLNFPMEAQSARKLLGTTGFKSPTLIRNGDDKQELPKIGNTVQTMRKSSSVKNITFDKKNYGFNKKYLLKNLSINPRSLQKPLFNIRAFNRIENKMIFSPGSTLHSKMKRSSSTGQMNFLF